MVAGLILPKEYRISAVYYSVATKMKTTEPLKATYYERNLFELHPGIYEVKYRRFMETIHDFVDVVVTLRCEDTELFITDITTKKIS